MALITALYTPTINFGEDPLTQLERLLKDAAWSSLGDIRVSSFSRHVGKDGEPTNTYEVVLSTTGPVNLDIATGLGLDFGAAPIR
ncbi:MAG: hypothetical protein BWY79_01336 [Actinobacteria bacterium ADurb.Bin444]|nr:MAG: hypothetical protein BWY79_01336 [Actinobacteria bacterium ADurb.Bin444]